MTTIEPRELIRTADEAMDSIVAALSEADAVRIVSQLPARLLRDLVDLLYLENTPRKSADLVALIVKEARA